jgi:putative ABC transport system substrate-binding protein
MPIVGFLSGTSPDDRAVALRQGLTEAGYVVGQNVAIEYRWAQGESDKLPELVADLLRLQPTVIVVAGSTAGAVAAKAATTTVPIVFVIGGDPVTLGLVRDLNRPSGNVTGVSFFGNELGAKRLALLREPFPAPLRSPFSSTQATRIVKVRPRRSSKPQTCSNFTSLS